MATTTTVYGISVPSASDAADQPTQATSAYGTIDAALAGSWVRKTLDQSVTSSTVLTNDSTLVKAVLANSAYYVRLMLIYQGAATPLMKIGFTAPAGATFDWGADGLVSTVTAATAGSIDRVAESVASSLVLGVDGATSVMAMVEGWLITAGTAGNLQFQFAQSVSNASAVTVKAGSVLWLRKTA